MIINCTVIIKKIVESVLSRYFPPHIERWMFIDWKKPRYHVSIYREGIMVVFGASAQTEEKTLNSALADLQKIENQYNCKIYIHLVDWSYVYDDGGW